MRCSCFSLSNKQIGWAGLAAAKTYLQVDPSIDLTIIDAQSTLGGIWAKDRIYPGLIADSPCGYFDFSDMPMGPVVGLKDLDVVPGEKVYKYLSAWADKHFLKERMRLKSRVTKLTRNLNGSAWNVTIEYESGTEILTCDKLILATGLASQSNLPDTRRVSYSGILGPSNFATSGFGYKFLHSGRNSVGTWISQKVWEIMATNPFKMNPHGSKSENVGNLLPVYGDSITSPSDITATLTTSDVRTTTISSDTTGFPPHWSVDAPFISHDPSLALELGLPTPVSSLSPADKDYLSFLDSAADKSVCVTFPELSATANIERQPEFQMNTPFRLYRHILPPALAAKGDRSLIHLGLKSTTQRSTYSEVSALWGIAWMEGLLTPTSDPASRSKIELDEEVAKVNAWSARSHQSRGSGRQFHAGEIVEVIDLLMTDLGLSPHRKGWFGIKDMFVPCKSQDFGDIVEEVLTRESMSGQIS